MSNMEIWNKVKSPDPKYTKVFNRGGGFKGTATNTQYLVMRATEIFGPNGVGWGVEITDEQWKEGSALKDGSKTIVHIIRGFVWYVIDGNRHETSQQYGQTTFVGENKYGPFTDEEAPKKSVTDMMMKCMSLIGFSADIFLGLWDDNKYVAELAMSKNTRSYEWLLKDVKVNSDSLEALNAWYKDYKTDIEKLPAADRKKLLAEMTSIKNSLTAPETIACKETGNQVTAEDCRQSKCSSTFEKCKS